MDHRLQLPGQVNAWTMPIRNRIDMLTTGIRTPVGVKIFGSDLKTIEKIGTEIESVVRTVPGTRGAYGERVNGGYFVDFDLDRNAIALYAGSGNVYTAFPIVEDPKQTMIKAAVMYYGRPVTDDQIRARRHHRICSPNGQ